MLEKFQNHIHQKLPFLFENKVFVAVSGGVDSMVLVDLLQKSDIKFTILHCNFNLRAEESEAETQFIRNFGKQNNIPYVIRYFETKKYAEKQKLSIQLSARELRYNWFKQEVGDGFLLTAHHADDNLETFLINLSRGTGIEGLTGIPEQNDYIIRPLLPFSRNEILDYAKENRVEWKEDSSNASDKYLRNKIRHQIVPLLKDLHPTFIENFKKTQTFLQSNQQFVENVVDECYQKVVNNQEGKLEIDIIKLLQFQNWKMLLYHWLKPFNFKAWDDIYQLVSAESGKQIFSDNFTLLKDRTSLFLFKTGFDYDVFKIDPGVKSLKIPLKMTFEKVNSIRNPSRNTIFVNEDKLEYPLELRKRLEADVFYPSGMQGKKKVSKFFKDGKYSLLEKENQWLLTSENEIVWIVGKRVDQRFLANENTQHILKIEILE